MAYWPQSSNDYAIAKAFNLEYIKQLQEVIDVANNSNSYNELIGVYGQSKNAPIANSIISVRRERPPGRAKNDVEIQKSSTKNIAI
ncbi:12069_t:CDS:2, partial [Gigaspora margarita]